MNPGTYDRPVRSLAASLQVMHVPNLASAAGFTWTGTYDSGKRAESMKGRTHDLTDVKPNLVVQN